jgi:probable F420-dependent oxidoreductase
MRVGIHLPQFGRAITPGGVQRAARAAEEQGFHDLWVSDHLVIPKEQRYPGAYILDPLTTLAFAGAVTERVGLATSVLVGPQYASPLQLANSLASLDVMSDGRLTVGLGIGWSPRESEALGGHYDRRGARLDEMIRLFRTVWEQSTADFEGEYYPSFEQIRVLPMPAHRIPLWIGGGADAAIERALRNDGYHGSEVAPGEAPELVARLRARCPDDDFVVSVRITWNVEEVEPRALADDLAAYRAAGVGAVNVVPDRGDIDLWLQNQEALARSALS